jgi:hypothetical protein
MIRPLGFMKKAFMVGAFWLTQLHYLKKGVPLAYVGVASFRNSFEYAKTKDTTLDLIYSQVSENTINQNRLLEIRDGIIHFKYEETL